MEGTTGRWGHRQRHCESLGAVARGTRGDRDIGGVRSRSQTPGRRIEDQRARHFSGTQHRGQPPRRLTGSVGDAGFKAIQRAAAAISDANCLGSWGWCACGPVKFAVLLERAIVGSAGGVTPPPLSPPPQCRANTATAARRRGERTFPEVSLELTMAIAPSTRARCELHASSVFTQLCGVGS